MKKNTSTTYRTYSLEKITAPNKRKGSEPKAQTKKSDGDLRTGKTK